MSFILKACHINPPGTEVAITQAGNGTVFLFVCPGFTRILLLTSKVQHPVTARVGFLLAKYI